MNIQNDETMGPSSIKTVINMIWWGLFLDITNRQPSMFHVSENGGCHTHVGYSGEADERSDFWVPHVQLAGMNTGIAGF